MSRVALPRSLSGDLAAHARVNIAYKHRGILNFEVNHDGDQQTVYCQVFGAGNYIYLTFFYYYGSFKYHQHIVGELKMSVFLFVNFVMQYFN